MNHICKTVRELRDYLLLWSTQSFSSLGSAMTSYALVVWSYQRYGSALTTALLYICSYAPYVLFGAFAGALSDKWNKRHVLLVCNACAALCSATVLFLFATDRLAMWNLYAVNAVNGLINTVQQPATDVATSLLVPKKHYQKTSGMRSFSGSLVTILAPVAAMSLFAFAGVQTVLFFDIFTFAAALFALLFFIRMPVAAPKTGAPETVCMSAKSGLRFLKEHRGILRLILFLAVINFTVSIYEAALPAMLLSRAGGGKLALGMVGTVSGLATMLGGILVSFLPPPKSRVRVIFDALLFSMSIENFLLAFGRGMPAWCLGAVLGWILIPFMGANMDVLLRTNIPISMQGRVYATRNTLQFFTKPVGYLCGGILIDRVFEPFMASQTLSSPWTLLFGAGKGSGAAMLFAIIGVIGSLSCLPFRKDPHIRALEEPRDSI